MASDKQCLCNRLSCVSFVHILCLIFRLESLTCLSLNHNQLTSIPRELGFLKNLSELQLNYNQLICIPEEIKLLKKLQKLLLARNNIAVLPEVSKAWNKIFFGWGRTTRFGGIVEWTWVAECTPSFAFLVIRWSQLPNSCDKG